jgi:hypothetical protein
MSALDFQIFQRDFARHVRDPHRTPRPAGVPARRMAVYNELLFNNITGFLDACFPVCRAILGERRWRRLNRSFYRDWKAHTPWFREIPHEFVRYLSEAEIRQALPVWLAELAHYEWAELAVDSMDCPVPRHDAEGDLMQQPLVLNPTLFNLAYAWPVHRIGASYRPRKPVATHLLVFRDEAEQVQFVKINPLTARLLLLLASEPLSGQAACRRMAEELQHPDPARLATFGAALLEDLRRQGIVLGTRA